MLSNHNLLTTSIIFTESAIFIPVVQYAKMNWVVDELLILQQTAQTDQIAIILAPNCDLRQQNDQTTTY